MSHRHLEISAKLRELAAMTTTVKVDEMPAARVPFFIEEVCDALTEGAKIIEDAAVAAHLEMEK